MSKSKRKTHKEVEYLRGVVRKLRADLRKCKKGHIEHIQEDEDTEAEESNPIYCTECGKGALKLVDLGVAVFTICNVCEIRKRL